MIKNIYNFNRNLISAGINLNSDKGDKFNQIQFEKVSKSAINFIRYLKNHSDSSIKKIKFKLMKCYLILYAKT